MRRIRYILPLVAALAALALPALADADYHQVIKDCSEDGKFDHTYSPGDLNAARDNLPTDIREYTDCKSLIEAALAKGGTGGSSGGLPGGGGGGLPGGGVTTPSGAAGTPEAVAALKSATASARGAKPSIVANGERLTPAASGLNGVPGAANKLPSSLVLAIVAVVVLGALGGMAATWRRWPALLRAPLRRFSR
jgi:hypothetical protein